MSDVIVAGSINVDIVATVSRHPRPSETVAGHDLRFSPGGKGANQAVSAARAGATVRLLAALGDDTFADEALKFLGDAGVDVRGVQRHPDLPTGTALNVVAADGENTIVAVPGANAAVTPASMRPAGASRGDVFVAQYEIPLACNLAFFEHGREVGATCILNPAPMAPTPPGLLRVTDVLVVNETELASLSGVPVAAEAPVDDMAGALEGLRRHGFAGVAVATLGARGALAVAGERRLLVDGHVVQAIDTTGAGDCFVGSLAAELAIGSTIDAAVRFANSAAAVSVTRRGAGPSMPGRAEVAALLERERG